jgi:AAA domain
MDWTPTDEQREILDAPASARLLVTAPPGTGKTAVACARVARMLQDSRIAPSNVLIISFTRTAVAEIRSRIERHVGSAASASAIPITTVDSQAWALQQGFSEDSSTVAGLLGRDYDVTVQNAIELLRTPTDEVRDFLERFEHVVVDEAQDLVGIRLDLVAELTRALPPQCGVTIFADFMQAIYDFADENADDAVITTDQLRTRLGGAFEEKRLTRMHRFKSKELAAVLAEIRTLLESSGLNPGGLRKGVSDVLQRQDIVKPVSLAPWKLANHPGIANEHGLLVLFRTRAEALCASGSLSGMGVAHRVRMSGLPDCLQPWIGRVFSGFIPQRMVLLHSEFKDRAQEKGLSSEEIDGGWELLRRLAKKGDGIDWRRLRWQLSRDRPPVEACFLDVGHSGPTVGTVHASKGREAEMVLYSMPPEGKDTFEEARVDYVAYTRATMGVSVGEAMPYASADASGRAYRIEWKAKVEKSSKMVHMEVGRDGDVRDRWTGFEAHWIAAQEHLWRMRSHPESIDARATKDADWDYELRTDAEAGSGIFLGRLSKFLRNDAFSIGKVLSGKVAGRWTPAVRLYDVFRVATRTVVYSEDEARLAELPDEARDSGYYLSPVIRGWSRVYFNLRG